MADMSFDVVIVGGGNKASVAAMYLTKYGKMSVGLFEDRHEAMAGWCAEEAPTPGFIAHQCSHLHADTLNYHRPLWDDFPEWKDYGADYVDRKVNYGFVDKVDQRWCGGYNLNLDPEQQKTYELFARFSQKDADTWMWITDKMNKYWEPAFLKWVFNPAVPYGQKDAMDNLIANPDAGIDPLWLTYTPVQIYHELFEDPFVQATFVRAMQSGGIEPDGAGQGLTALLAFCNWRRAGTAKGGNHQLAHATQRVIAENGGKFFYRSPVAKILIENGRAKGIKLENGTEIEAKKAVLSGVDPYQFVFNLVGPEHFDPLDVKRVKALSMDWITIGWYTWALHEQPKFYAEKWGEDIDHCMWLCSGTKDIEDVARESYQRRMNEWPDPENFQMIISNHSNAEPDCGYAPLGKACVITEQFVNPAWRYTEAEWKVIEKRFADEQIRHWQKYCPNMTWDNVIGYVPITPFYTSRHARNWGRSGNWNVLDMIPSQVGRNRPTPNLASGRIPGVKGLYATGAGWHPFGWGQSFQGYWTYKNFAQDFGLPKPWEEKGREF